MPIKSNNHTQESFIDPANGAVMAKLPGMTAADCETSIQAAAGAFPRLKGMTGMMRGELLRRWYNLTMENQKDLATIISTENGKPYPESLGEVAYAASFLDWFTGEAHRVTGSVGIEC